MKILTTKKKIIIQIFGVGVAIAMGLAIYYIFNFS
jgi:hypothetical protein